MGLSVNDRSYFAKASHEDIGRRLTERLRPIREEKFRDNREVMIIAYSHIYGRDVGYGATAGIYRGGEKGELALLRVNTAAANARARLSLVTSAQLTWKAQAKDGTASAAEATSVATDVLENEWKTNHLGVICDLWTEWAIYFSVAFVFPEWRRGIGPPLAPRADGTMVNQGDLFYRCIPPWDVFVDNSAKTFRDCTWLFVRIWQNRHELAEEHKCLADGREGDEAKEAILSASQGAWDASVSDGDRLRTETELVPVWYFFHHPTALLPMGRFVKFVSDTVVLVDEPVRGPNATYEGVPIERLAERDMVDSPHAWAPFWDTLGCQEIQDGIDTSLATISTTLGNPIIAVEQGSDFPEILASGFRTWKYPRGAKPPMQVKMGEFPPEALDYRENLQTNQRQLMGLNDVALGQPQGAQMNAQAFAVLMSAAVQQASPLQSARVAAVSHLGTTVLKLLAKHVKNQRSFVKDSGETVNYSANSLAAVDKAHVEVGNPLEQTAAGRKAILDDKIQLGFITSNEQYDQQLATGRSDSLTLRTTAEMTLVQWEVEQLKRGVCPPVHHSFDHPLHFKYGAVAVLNPKGEQDANVLKAVEDFLEQHYQLQFGTPRANDPLALVRERWMMGQQIGPGQDQPPPGPGGPGGPPGAGAPPPGGGQANGALTQPDGGSPPPTPDVQMPNNPATGQPIDPVSGGGAVQLPQ